MSEKKQKKDENAPSVFLKLKFKFTDIKGEFKKIIWPDRKSLVKHTINVILVSGLIGGVIVVLDFLFGNGYNLFVSLFS